jgi:cell wall-associated NlpC family hydrolase
MKTRVKYLLVIALSIAFAGCQSAVRFASNDATPEKGSNTAQSAKPANSKSAPPVNENSTPVTGPENPTEEKIIEEARKWLGVPYKYGGNTRSGIDCSGFVVNVYNELGVKLPRTSRQQYNFARKVGKSNLRVGDLVFFGRSRVNHVGIYIGNNMMIHASSSRGVVKQNLNDSYYARNYAGSGRVLD